MMGHTGQDHEWQRLWDAREDALASVLGEIDDLVSHSTVPFDLGFDVGGAADVVHFNKHVEGRVSVTAELIGNEDQMQNALGNYELAICEPDTQVWGAAVISTLAYYSLQNQLRPMETMNIESVVPEGSRIVAFMFVDYARFEVLGQKCGLLLCQGITEEELRVCRRGSAQQVLTALKEDGIFPLTDLSRNSSFEWHGWFTGYRRTART